MAALAPMPSASVATTVAARPLTRSKARSANRKSRASASAASNQRCRHTRRIESRVSVTLPNSRNAASRADAASSPCSIRSRVLIARCPRISSSRSSSPGRMGLLLRRSRRVHDPSDCVDQLRPSIAFAHQLRFARSGQLVVPRPLVPFAGAPPRFEPAPFEKAMQRRIQRTGFDTEQIVGLRPDRLADPVTVLRPPLEGAEDEHVERALEKLQPLVFRAFGHSRRQSTALDVGCLRRVPFEQVLQVAATGARSHSQYTGASHHAPNGAFVSTPAIAVQNLVKTFGSRLRPIRAVDDLTFSVAQGSIFGLLGPNGAGKTTTLRIMTTLARPTAGTVDLLGHNVVSEPLEGRRRIGVVIQEQAADLLLNVRDNLLTFARFHGAGGAPVRQRADRVMAQFGIADVAERKVQDLSGGIRRRVQVAKMFMVDVPVIFLDEFSSGMDAILKRGVMDMLRAQAAAGRTIVLTTQILTEAEELCDDILIINNGRQVARGNVHDLKQLVGGLHEVTITFDRVPENLTAIVAGYAPERTTVLHNTVQL